MLISGDLGFTVFGRFITYYGLFIVLGVAAGALLARFQCRKLNLVFENAVGLTCICGLCAIVGAKVLYIAVSIGQIDVSRLADPAYLSSLLAGGFVFYGGLLGALAGLPLAGALLSLDVRPYVNALAPALALGHGIGRLGCLAAGCCYGMPYDGPLAVVYDHSLAAPAHTPLFPVQLAEAVGEFAIAALLTYLVQRKGFAHAGTLYVALYAVMRFLLEFLRYDDAERGFMGFFSTSQWISLALLAVLALYAVRLRRASRARQAA